MEFEKVKNFQKKVGKYGFGYFYNQVLGDLGFNRKKDARKYIEKYYQNLTPEKREEDLKEWFVEQTGYPLDLNNPKTFDEKIQWLKLYDSTPIKTQLADKYLVRNWVAEQIGDKYIIPMLGVWDSFDEIDFSKLPDKFVLKANHGYNMNLIVQNKNKIDMKKARQEVDSWLEVNFGLAAGQQLHYSKIKPKVLAEHFLEDDHLSLADYKVYCFNGKPLYIQMIKDRFDKPEQAFFDVNWKMQPFIYKHYEKMIECPKRPKQLDILLQLSEILSEQFAFVRVDWYLPGDFDIYFGEMTFTPAEGVMRWIPSETDEMLGSLLDLPDEKYIFE